MGTELALRGVSETALDLPADLSFEEWEDAGRSLGRIDSARQWWIGDWLNYGERKWGEGYSQGMEATGVPEGTLSVYASIARNVLTRFKELSWKHHYEVAKLEPEAQEVWLIWADQEEERDGDNPTKGRLVGSEHLFPPMTFGPEVPWE